jgi:N12 class adenine-specific DNA methylase
MATRAYVILEEKGFFKVIYNHSSGYFDDLGLVLFDKYKTRHQVEALIERGNAHSIAYDDYYDKDDDKHWNALAIREIEEDAHEGWIEYLYWFDKNDTWQAKGLRGENAESDWKPLQAILLPYILKNLTRELKSLKLPNDNLDWKRKKTIGNVPSLSATNAIESIRQKLNQVYDAFVKKYGNLGSKDIALLREDADWELVAALENEGKKADIFSQRITYAQTIPTTAENLQDAFRISINYKAKVDVDYIASLLNMDSSEVENLLTTQSFSQVIGTESVERPLVFRNPRNGLLEDAEEYLSGEVRVKLALARTVAEEDSRYRINVPHLEKAQPVELTLDEIKFNLGSSWIPSEVIEDFVYKTLGIKCKITLRRLAESSSWDLELHSNYDGKNRITSKNKFYGLYLSSDERTSTYYIEQDGEQVAIERDQPAISNKLGHDLVQSCLNNKTEQIRRYKIDGKGKVMYREVSGKQVAVMEQDDELTNVIQTKKATLQREFKSFVINNAEEYVVKLEEIYNKHFNDNVKRIWTIPDIEVYPGANPKIKLRPHQKRGVKRCTSGSGFGGFHGVGSGKTFTIITSAMELRRLGLARKPMIVAQNATIEQFIAEARKLYPNAKILAPTIRDGVKLKMNNGKIEADENTLQKALLTRKDRLRNFAKIATGDWDMIILPQSQFDLIGDDPKRRQAYILERVQEAEESYEKAVAEKNKTLANRLRAKIDKYNEQIGEAQLEMMQNEALTQKANAGPKVKDIARKNIRTENRLLRQADRKEDTILYFEQMGIDALLIDEFHAYKRLGFETQMQNIKGIDTAGSKRAFSVMLKIMHIYEKLGAERNVSGWTGTPISNTMAEMWTMMKYLSPATLKKHYAEYFDEFAQNFGEIIQSFEMDAGGRYKLVNRFAKYNNLPELLGMWHKFADVVLSQEVLGKSKDMDAETYLKNFNPAESIPLLKEQTRVNANGKVEKYRGFTAVNIPKSKQQAKQIKIFRGILEWYDELEGKDKKRFTHVPLLLFNYARRATVDLRLLPDSMRDVPYLFNNVADDLNKANACAEKAFEIYQSENKRGRKTAQLLFCDSFKREEPSYEQINKDGTPKMIEVFNVYVAIRDKLIALGVPSKEIVIINDIPDNKREQLFQSVNDGIIRFLLGSTERMGVGVNVQEKLIALHHIDAPLRPMDFEQRNGRIIRQKNTNPEIDVLTYGIEKTMDAVAYSRLRIKQTFIDQVMSGKITGRSTEDELEDGEGFFASLSATLTGSTTAVDLLEAQKRKQAAEAEASFEEGQKVRQSKELAKQRALLTAYEYRLPILQGFADEIRNATAKGDDRFTIRTITVNGKTYSEDFKKTVKEKQVKYKTSEILEEFVMKPLYTEVIEKFDLAWKNKDSIRNLNAHLTIELNGMQVEVSAQTAESVSNDKSRTKWQKIDKIESVYIIWTFYFVRQNESIFSFFRDSGEVMFWDASGLQANLHTFLRQIVEKEVSNMQDKAKNARREIQSLSKAVEDTSRMKQLNDELFALDKKVHELQQILIAETRQAKEEEKDLEGLFGFNYRSLAGLVKMDAELCGDVGIYTLPKYSKKTDLGRLIRELRSLRVPKS